MIIIGLLVVSTLFSVIYQYRKKVGKQEIVWNLGTQILIIIGGSLLITNKREWCGIFLVLANLSVGIYLPYLLRRLSATMNINLGKELSNMEYKHYEISVENDKKIRAIRHDISNHIQTVYFLLKNGENQKSLELINELKQKYACVEQIVYCENPVVNIILSNKRNEAELKGIETHIKVKAIPESIPVSDFDLSTVFCNLLDNAISGCVDSEQSHPRLIVELVCKNQYLVIRVLNSCRISMNIQNTDKIDTTKSNSQTHGFGMPIVAGIAKKYRGDFVVSAQNGIFTATVVLSIK